MNLHYLEHLARLGRTDLHPGGRSGSRRLERALALRAGDRVLEIGCGTGQMLIRLASAHDIELKGVDALEDMLLVARRRLLLTGLSSRAAVVSVDAARGLPSPDAAFDRAYCESVLGFQSSRDARAILAETYRVLKPGGRFVTNEAVWKDDVGMETVSAIYDAAVKDFGLAPASGQGWTRAQWTECMTDVGFVVLEVEPLGERAPPEGKDPRSPSRKSLRLAALTISAAVTWFYRIRGRLSPGLRKKSAEYRGRLRRYEGVDQPIAAYLFVLEKPRGPSD